MHHNFSLLLLSLSILLQAVVTKASLPFKDQCVKWHNDFRAKHQASPVTWDPVLANDAKKWANYLAANNLFQHDRNRRNQGENLYWSSKKPANPCIVATQRFYDEVKYYDFNKPGFSSRTGHFTQVRNFVSHEHCAAHLRQTRKPRTQESHHNFYGNHWLSIECSKGPKHNWRALS